MKIVVTAGPTNEHIDAVMKITNMSTGSLGCRIVDTILDDGELEPQVDKIYYICPKLAYMPKVNAKVERIQIQSADELLEELSCLLATQQIDVVVHSSAVGDYKGRYVMRGEDLAAEIAVNIMDMVKNPREHINVDRIEEIVMETMKDPVSVQNSATKISSYEPNLMVMLGLTPKVIGNIKKLSPDTMLIGFKLLEGVSEEELFEVAARLREKNKADYIIANDLSRIGNGKHWAMVVGENEKTGKSKVLETCETKADIAESIVRLIKKGKGQHE